MSMNIRFPNITGVKPEEQIMQIKSYLYQLVEQLNWMLPAIESSTGQAGTSSANLSLGDISAETFYELKSLLIKSSDTLNAYYEKINVKLEGQYVNQSDFDGHKQEITQLFIDLGSKYVAQKDFNSYKEAVTQLFDGLASQYVAQSAFDAFKQENDGVIAGLDSKYVSQADYDANKQEVSQDITDLQENLGKLQQIIVSVSLPASQWVGSENIYSQVVSIDGITENSQVNLTPSVEQLSIFSEENVSFITENDGGVVTVYVIGQKPTNDYTIKASIVEVSHA